MSNFKCEKCGMTNIDCGEDGFKTPKEIELEACVKELEKYLQELFETLKIDNTGIFWDNSLEYYATRTTTAKNKIKELDEIAIKLNTRVEQQTEEKYNLNMDVLKLERKLKIAEKALKYYTDGEDICEAKLQCSDTWGYIVNDNYTDIAKQALQKMEEMK